MTNDKISYISDKLEDSSDYYSSLISRKKRDIEIYSGNFWNNDMISTYDRKGRVCSSFTQYSKFANAIVSPFSRSSYHCEIEDSDGKFSHIQDEIDKFENDSNTKYTILCAVKNACITGTGFIVLSIEDNKIFPELVRDVGQVALDPNIIELDGSDAEYGAIVTYISITKAKRLYGKDVVNYDKTSKLSSIGDQWSIPNDSVPLVSFYEINDSGVCELTKVCGNKVIMDTVQLPFKRIPIYRICFNEVIRNGKVDYNGIVDMTSDIMLAQSIAFSTIIERANRSPKANYMMEVSQLDGLEEFYKRLNTKESLVCLYNGEKVNTPPVPIIETYQTSDLQSTIDTTANLMAQVIGVPIGGINPGTDTATEVLVQQANSESNVYSLYSNASSAIRSMSETIVSVFCEYYNIDTIPTFRLINGPEVITQNMKTRAELSIIANMLTDETSRKIIAKHYIDTFDASTKDDLKADLIANDTETQYVSEYTSQPEPAALIQQLNMLQQQFDTLTQQYQELSKTAEELKNENDQLNLSLIDQKQQNILAAQKQRNDYELQVAKLEQEQQKINNDKVKTDADIQLKSNDQMMKNILELEKQKKEVVTQEVLQ